MRSSLLFTVAIATVVLCTEARAVACRAGQAELTAAVEAVHRKQRNVGVQAAIWLDDRIVYSSALGWADKDKRVPVDRRTVFPIASVTKAFTGVALLKAVEQDKIGLDEPIQRYVPDFPPKELVITPRRLAAHRAGLRHWGPERDGFFSRRFTLEETVAAVRGDPLVPDAGKDYQYSSYGYNILGLAVQNATEVPFTRWVEQQVLVPLQLTNTIFDDARRPRPRSTKAYTFYDLRHYYELPEPETVPPLDYSHNIAGGNMSTTAEDLARFGGAFFGPGFLSASSYNLLTTRPEFDGRASGATFGFFASKPGAEPRLSLTGSNPGVQSGIAIYPNRRIAVAVLSNTWGVGSRAGEMGSDLPARLADLCAPAPSA